SNRPRASASARRARGRPRLEAAGAGAGGAQWPCRSARYRWCPPPTPTAGTPITVDSVTDRDAASRDPAATAANFALLTVFFPMWNEEAYIDRALAAA